MRGDNAELLIALIGLMAGVAFYAWDHQQSSECRLRGGEWVSVGCDGYVCVRVERLP